MLEEYSENCHQEVHTIAIVLSKPALTPKSVIFASPLRFTSKFAGFISLYTEECTKSNLKEVKA